MHAFLLALGLPRAQKKAKNALSQKGTILSGKRRKIHSGLTDFAVVTIL